MPLKSERSLADGDLLLEIDQVPSDDARLDSNVRTKDLARTAPAASPGSQQLAESVVAVGMSVAQHPPHKTIRACLTHTVLIPNLESMLIALSQQCQ
jgi:hypothetical protein